MTLHYLCIKESWFNPLCLARAAGLAEQDFAQSGTIDSSPIHSGVRSI